MSVHVTLFYSRKRKETRTRKSVCPWQVPPSKHVTVCLWVAPRYDTIRYIASRIIFRAATSPDGPAAAPTVLSEF
jgi:hypothetical protein